MLLTVNQEKSQGLGEAKKGDTEISIQVASRNQVNVTKRQSSETDGGLDTQGTLMQSSCSPEGHYRYGGGL